MTTKIFGLQIVYGSGSPVANAENNVAYIDTDTSALWVYDNGWLQLSSGGFASVTQNNSTAYTFKLSDAQKYIQFTNGGAITATIPLNSSVAFPIGTELNFEQTGAGQVTVTAAGGVTLNAASGHVASAVQFAVATIKKVAIDTWTLFGNLA